MPPLRGLVGGRLYTVRKVSSINDVGRVVGRIYVCDGRVQRGFEPGLNSMWYCIMSASESIKLY
jgi:hypothetical protein